jgi:hypothetical protein
MQADKISVTGLRKRQKLPVDSSAVERRRYVENWAKAGQLRCVSLFVGPRSKKRLGFDKPTEHCAR